MPDYTEILILEIQAKERASRQMEQVNQVLTKQESIMGSLARRVPEYSGAMLRALDQTGARARATAKSMYDLGESIAEQPQDMSRYLDMSNAMGESFQDMYKILGTLRSHMDQLHLGWNRQASSGLRLAGIIKSQNDAYKDMSTIFERLADFYEKYRSAGAMRLARFLDLPPESITMLRRYILVREELNKIQGISAEHLRQEEALGAALSVTQEELNRELRRASGEWEHFSGILKLLGTTILVNLVKWLGESEDHIRDLAEVFGPIIEKIKEFFGASKEGAAGAAEANNAAAEATRDAAGAQTDLGAKTNEATKALMKEVEGLELSAKATKFLEKELERSGTRSKEELRKYFEEMSKFDKVMLLGRATAAGVSQEDIDKLEEFIKDYEKLGNTQSEGAKKVSEYMAKNRASVEGMARAFEDAAEVQKKNVGFSKEEFEEWRKNESERKKGGEEAAKRAEEFAKATEDLPPGLKIYFNLLKSSEEHLGKAHFLTKMWREALEDVAERYGYIYDKLGNLVKGPMRDLERIEKRKAFMQRQDVLGGAIRALYNLPEGTGMQGLMEAMESAKAMDRGTPDLGGVLGAGGGAVSGGIEAAGGRRMVGAGAGGLTINLQIGEETVEVMSEQFLGRLGAGIGGQL